MAGIAHMDMGTKDGVMARKSEGSASGAAVRGQEIIVIVNFIRHLSITHDHHYLVTCNQSNAGTGRLSWSMTPFSDLARPLVEISEQNVTQSTVIIITRHFIIQS